MSARILDGRVLATEMEQEIAARATAFLGVHGQKPKLAAVLVGEDPASQVYVRKKQEACERVGMDSSLDQLPANVTEKKLLDRIAQLNEDPSVHGILVQLPLPPTINSSAVLHAVDPNKDVDGFHPENMGLLMAGLPRFVPCTPAGIQQILIRSRIETAGRHVVIVGRSLIVGRPLSILLTNKGRGGDATVTICHSRTSDLPSITHQADILIAAVGHAGLIGPEMVQAGAVVIDVGTNRGPKGKLVGDVDLPAVIGKAGAITPVPGGVGPMTVTMLLSNTLHAAERLGK